MSVSLRSSVFSSGFCPMISTWIFSAGVCSIIAAIWAYPIVVRVQDKGNISHLSIWQLLFEAIAGIFNSLASCLDVIDANTNMPKSLPWIGIAIVNLEAFIIFAPMLIFELQLALTISGVTFKWSSLREVVCQSIEVKVFFGMDDLLDDF